MPEPSSFVRQLFFSGKMNLNWGRHYSLGVRQAVYRAHRHDPRVLIMTFDNGVQEKVLLAPCRQRRRHDDSLTSP